MILKKKWEGASDFFKKVFDGVKVYFEFLRDVIAAAFKLSWDYATAVWDVATAYFKGICDSIAGIFKVVTSILTGNWREAWEGIKQIVGGWVRYFKAVWEGIQKVFGSVGTYFKNIFNAAWTAVKKLFPDWANSLSELWNRIRKSFSSLGTKIADSMGGAIKSGINAVIKLIEDRINHAIELINGAIGLINYLPGVNISRLNNLSLPRLAQGGVLENGAKTVVAGEDGAEAIVPLEKNTKWIKMVANQMKNSFFPSSINQPNTLYDMQVQTKFDILVDSFKQALSEMKIEMDETTMGKFVETTVSNAIYG